MSSSENKKGPSKDKSHPKKEKKESSHPKKKKKSKKHKKDKDDHGPPAKHDDTKKAKPPKIHVSKQDEPREVQGIYMGPNTRPMESMTGMQDQLKPLEELEEGNRDMNKQAELTSMMDMRESVEDMNEKAELTSRTDMLERVEDMNRKVELLLLNSDMRDRVEDMNMKVELTSTEMRERIEDMNKKVELINMDVRERVKPERPVILVAVVTPPVEDKRKLPSKNTVLTGGAIIDIIINLAVTIFYASTSYKEAIAETQTVIEQVHLVASTALLLVGALTGIMAILAVQKSNKILMWIWASSALILLLMQASLSIALLASDSIPVTYVAEIWHSIRVLGVVIVLFAIKKINSLPVTDNDPLNNVVNTPAGRLTIHEAGDSGQPGLEKLGNYYCTINDTTAIPSVRSIAMKDSMIMSSTEVSEQQSVN